MVFAATTYFNTLVQTFPLKAFHFFIIVLLVSCAAPKVSKVSTAPSIQSYIDTITKIYAPDKRTTLFTIEAEGKLLKGETTSPDAKAALLSKLTKNNISYIDSIKVLPEAELGDAVYAVVTISVANLRTGPEHKAELATQATLGTPLKVWKKERGWYLVQTPDQYLSYVDDGAIERMNASAYASWLQKPKIIYTDPFGLAYASTSNSETVSDLVYGNVLALKATHPNYYEALLPDGRTAFIPTSQAMLFNEWKTSRVPDTSNFIQTAKRLMGIPYLWGGTSFKGVDCSGFTKTVYFMNGLVLPRDASQQVHYGDEIDTNKGWDKLQPGDLLFFGTKGDGTKPERVVHVGMWLGNNEFIHASGKVRVNSLDPAAANYNANEHKRFLRAKRISPTQSLIDLRKVSLF